MRSRRWPWQLLWLICWLLLPFSGGTAETEATVEVPGQTVWIGEATLIRYTLPEDTPVELVLMDEKGAERFPVARGVQGRRGENSLYWNGTYLFEEAPEGDWTLLLDAGELWATSPVTIGRRVPEMEMEETAPRGAGFTPATTSPFDGMDRSLNYWTLPMEITEEERVWQVLTAPITVVDNGRGEKAQLILRREPAQDSPGVGSVTCATQGVHVLQRGETWSLVECYSASFSDSPILNWNALVQGYVRTEYLQEIIPNQEMGLVIDKLTQRLYIFREGKLFSTLLVSTGLANRKQPYNETRSGEFLLTSKVGTFQSDSLLCGMAIRFNRGDLLHEVPHTVSENGTVSYIAYEKKLGQKASHGCIRVQRRKTPEGVNMAWIWANLKKNSRTRLLIWEDWQGRRMEMPSDALKLYYNPEDREVYHAKAHCFSQPEGTVLEEFTYGQLETEPFREMKKCEYCAPALRRKEIVEVNMLYAFGGDHDPVMTEARKRCPRPLR